MELNYVCGNDNFRPQKTHSEADVGFSPPHAGQVTFDPVSVGGGLAGRCSRTHCDLTSSAGGLVVMDSGLVVGGDEKSERTSR